MFPSCSLDKEQQHETDRFTLLLSALGRNPGQIKAQTRFVISLLLRRQNRTLHHVSEKCESRLKETPGQSAVKR